MSEAVNPKAYPLADAQVRSVMGKLLARSAGARRPWQPPADTRPLAPLARSCPRPFWTLFNKPPTTSS